MPVFMIFLLSAMKAEWSVNSCQALGMGVQGPSSVDNGPSRSVFGRGSKKADTVLVPTSAIRNIQSSLGNLGNASEISPDFEARPIAESSNLEITSARNPSRGDSA
jgi:hypothetical protein